MGIFIAIENVQKWRVIVLRALSPSKRFAPADIIHETVGHPKKLLNAAAAVGFRNLTVFLLNRLYPMKEQ